MNRIQRLRWGLSMHLNHSKCTGNTVGELSMKYQLTTYQSMAIEWCLSSIHGFESGWKKAAAGTRLASPDGNTEWNIVKALLCMFAETAKY